MTDAHGSSRSAALARILVAACLLAAAAAFLYGRGEREYLPASPPMRNFPLSMGAWQGTGVEIPDNIQQVLGKGDLMARRFSLDRRVPVDLFIGYFPSQRTGQSIHSPKNCLPGAGWMPVVSERISVPVPGRAAIHLNRYVLGNGRSRLLVYYWYQAHSRTVASEYWAKFFLVADAARLNRTDGSLVRVTSPVMDGEDTAAADERVRAFIRDLAPVLDVYIPI